MKRLYFFCIGAGLVTIAWLNQPYAGWHFCGCQGFVHEVKLIELVRPIVLEDAKSKEQANSINEAIDMLKECLVQRGQIDLCQYVGPDTKASVNVKDIANYEEEAGRYRFIVRNASAGLNASIFRKLEVMKLEFYGYEHRDQERSKSMNVVGRKTVCNLSCNCFSNPEGNY